MMTQTIIMTHISIISFHSLWLSLTQQVWIALVSLQAKSTPMEQGNPPLAALQRSQGPLTANHFPWAHVHGAIMQASSLEENHPEHEEHSADP